MKPTAQRLAVATVSMTPHLDPNESLAAMQRIVEETLDSHPETRLILFGETILGWFSKKGETQQYHESIAEPVPGPSTEAIGMLAKTHGIYISYGLSEREGERLYNTQVVISPDGGIVAKHRKFNIRNKVFTAGEEVLTTVEIDDLTAAVLICADVRSLRLRKQIRKAKVDLILASLADYATSSRLNQLLGTLYDAWTFVANRYGEEPPILWHGLITITDPWARLRGASLSKESVLVQAVPCARPTDLARWFRRRLVGLKLVILLLGFGGELLAAKFRKRRTDS